MAQAAIPLAISAGGSLLGKLFNRPTKTQQTALTGTQQGAQQLQQTGQSLLGQGQQLQGTAGATTGQGMGGLSTALNYYKTLLSGGRGGVEAATAPERAQALQYYQGAGNKIQRTLRGPQRDVAQEELDRQQVGQLADIGGRARAGAATGIANVGGQIGQLGSNLYSHAGALSGEGVGAQSNALYGQQAAFNQGTQIANQQRQGGNAIGGFLYDILKSQPWKTGGGGDQPYGPLAQGPAY